MRQTDVEEISSVPQPDKSAWSFLDGLRRKEPRKFHSLRRTAKKGETSLAGGVHLLRKFPDTQDLLRTAYSDLEDFFNETGIPADGLFEICTEQGVPCGPWDSYEIEITASSCIIRAANTEGIRRGIFHIEDMLLSAGGPFLPIGLIHRKAWMKNRISRCFFSPVRRPPDFEDELGDGVDYYPEVYLDRLAHEGVNGLWIRAEFNDISRIPQIPEWGLNAECKLAKLRNIVSRCRNYGIRIFLLTIEPCAFSSHSPLWKRYPELDGASTSIGEHCFCPSSRTAYEILSASTKSIFLAVPQLGGLINISLGERTTTCLSSLSPFAGSSTKIGCPRCAALSPEDILYHSVSAMAGGMHSVSPDAEFISWIYRAQSQEIMPWILKLSRKLPPGVTFMYNFESGGEMFQQGRKLTAGDYWLSYVGPSGRFETVAANLESSGQLGAKIQVGNSHECATVPYIPVPGLLYRKYRAMHRLGVSSCLMCWYFGNFPGLMNKAAGMLAFEDFSKEEHDFLTQLAAPLWPGHVHEITEIWKTAGEAYTRYPFSNAMQYYGPYHDGIVWPLYPNPQFLELTMTWMPDLPVSGDNIGDCLKDFTLSEAESQAHLLSSAWKRAFERMGALRKDYSNHPDRCMDIVLMESLQILFRSAEHIFRFYRLRKENRLLTDEMKKIMLDEAVASERMAELCLQVPSLGFHSESVAYRFFPEKLLARARQLRHFIDSPPPAAWMGTDYVVGGGFMQAENFAWQIESVDDGVKITVVLSGTYDTDEIFVGLSNGCEKPPICLSLNRCGKYSPTIPGTSISIKEKYSGWIAAFSIPFSIIDHSFRIGFVRYTDDPEKGIQLSSCPKIPGPIRARLLYGYLNVHCMLNVQCVRTVDKNGIKPERKYEKNQLIAQYLANKPV